MTYWKRVNKAISHHLPSFWACQIILEGIWAGRQRASIPSLVNSRGMLQVIAFSLGEVCKREEDAVTECGYLRTLTCGWCFRPQQILFWNCCFRKLLTWEKEKLGQAGSLDENTLWEPELCERPKIAGFRTPKSTGGILSLRTDLHTLRFGCCPAPGRAGRPEQHSTVCWTCLFTCWCQKEIVSVPTDR